MNAKTFTVEGLFGKNSTINLDLSKDIQIIFGINGSGKTTILKILHAMMTGSPHELRNIVFKSATLSFDDSTKIKIVRSKGDKQRARHSLNAFTAFVIDKRGRSKRLAQPGDDIDVDDHLLQRHFIHGSNQIYSSISDYYTAGQIFDTDLIQSQNHLFTNNEIRKQKSEPWKKLPVKFIQTQRLMIAKAEQQRSSDLKNGVRYQNTIIDYSEKLQGIIREKMSESMRNAQNRDGTYIRRLISSERKGVDNDQKLQELFNLSKSMGDRLRTVGLLDKNDSVEMSPSSISEEHKRAVLLYLNDSIEKYKFLEDISGRIELFLRLINEKFEPSKCVKIVGGDGLKIFLPNDQELPPAYLSSGEQHEMILLYELIFFSDAKTMVLIDEPEISLHVDWQRKFLSDLELIGKFTGLKFVIATHSPMIIGNRIDICQEI